MAGSPFNSLPIYTAATTNIAPPPPPPPPTTTEPTTTSTTTPTVNGSSKTTKTQQTPLTTPSACTCFRLLCHASRIGTVIGKSGSVIKQLQHDTSAQIRVENAPPGSEFRVISVVADSSVDREVWFGEDSNHENNGCDESSEYRQVSAAQEALVRVYERILSVAAETDGRYFAPGGVVSCRLLANTSFVGFLIGRGGKGIENIRKDTRCKIRIYNQDKLPSCAMPDDEMIEIEGGILQVKRALIAIARRIQDSPASDKSNKLKTGSYNVFNVKHVSPNGPNGHMVHSPPSRSHNGFKPAFSNRHMDHFPPARTAVQGPGLVNATNYRFGGLYSDSLGGGTSLNQQQIVFRFLCSSDRVGGVIGKSGTIVRAIEHQTGASISVESPQPHCDERMINISAFESPESQNSPAQNAVILVFSRSVETAYEKGLDSPSSGTPISARLVIPHSQMGCLLGKGGSIVADMRKVTGAFIKIVSGNQVARCVPENDEVVVMTGEFLNVRDALYSVTSRLRNHHFTSGPNNYGPGNGQPPFDPHANLTQRMDNLRPFNDVDHPSPSAPSQSQAGAGNVMNGHDVKGGIELGRGGRSAIITNTTVEIMVPESDIGCVYGENRSNLNRLRQISGAKVMVHEPGSDKTDYLVIISGSPDQTQSAQSLLQAFILADQQWQEYEG